MTRFLLLFLKLFFYKVSSRFRFVLWIDHNFKKINTFEEGHRSNRRKLIILSSVASSAASGIKKNQMFDPIPYEVI